MRKFLLLLSVFTVSFLVYSPVWAGVHVEGRYWFTKLDSKLQVTDYNVTGSEIYMKDTLGADNAENFWEAKIDLNSGSHHFIYSYMPLSWDGTKAPDNSINFAGSTYSANTTIESSLDIIYQRAGYKYTIGNEAGNQFGLIVDLKLIDVDANLRNSTLNKSYRVTGIIPTVGFAAGIGLPHGFAVGAEVTGIGYNGNHLFDGEVAVSFNYIPYTTISGGYRMIDIKLGEQYKAGNDKADFTIRGPFLMVRAGF